MRSKRLCVAGVVFGLFSSTFGLFAVAGTAEPTTAPTSMAPTSTAAPSTPVVPEAADSRVEASLALRFCPPKGCNGERVFIDSASNHYGSKGYSNCTKNETSTSFDLRADKQRFTVGMTARNGGSCTFEPSYNTWIVAVYLGENLISRGLITISQQLPGGSYSARCTDPSRWTNFGCEIGDGALSLVVSRKDERPQPPPPQYPCPSGHDTCYLNLHFDSKACPNFTVSIGACVGTSSGNSFPFTVTIQDLPALFAGFSWSGSGRRTVRFAVMKGVPNSVIDGSTDGTGSEFRVSDAWALTSPYPSVHWYTRDQTGVPPGELDGPLLLTFKNGIIGADVYLRGYLRRKP